MKDSALNKKQGDYTQFSPKKDSMKMKMDLILPFIFAITPVDRLCYRVINISILLEFFHLFQNVHHAVQKKQYELIRQDRN